VGHPEVPKEKNFAVQKARNQVQDLTVKVGVKDMWGEKINKKNERKGQCRRQGVLYAWGGIRKGVG